MEHTIIGALLVISAGIIVLITLDVVRYRKERAKRHENITAIIQSTNAYRRKAQRDTETGRVHSPDKRQTGNTLRDRIGRGTDTKTPSFRAHDRPAMEIPRQRMPFNSCDVGTIPYVPPVHPMASTIGCTVHSTTDTATTCSDF